MRWTIPAAAAISVAALLGGCAHENLAMAPIVDLAGRQCAPLPDFANPTPLVFSDKDPKETKAALDDKAPCVTDDKGPSMYAVFTLPVMDVPYTVEVDSVAAGNALFAPRILLYAKDGTLKRSLSGNQITPRGVGLGGIIRNHPDEFYLVVASDPSAVGQKDNRILSSTNVTQACTAYGCFEMHSGNENTATYTFSHNGRLSITVTPLEKPKK